MKRDEDTGIAERGSGQNPAVRAQRGINKENARAMVEYRRSIGKMGGRPKGVLNKKTIEKINSKEAFDKAVADRAGQLADDLFRNSRNGDTQAAKVLLEQTFGRARDNSADKLANAAFSLLAFAQRAAQLPKDANADVVKSEADAPTLPHPRPSSGD